MGDVSRSSITLSSASYASSLFPTVDEASSSLIEAILSRVSPSESEWKPFLQAYDEVFNERGLDKQSDTVIYDLILKLGLQSGKNWRAKWENVKRTQQELLLQREGAQRVDQGADRNNNVRTPISKTSGVRAAAGEHRYAHDYEEDEQPRLTREALDKLQHTASPYKALQTPFAAQPRISNRDGTTPRVHFAQDGHTQHSRAHSDVFRTPELSTPSSHTAEEREAMARQAVQIDRLNLLGRMYDDWISRLFVLKRLDMHTALARDALLKRRSLTFWHDRVKRHQELEERVELAYEATLQRSCLRLWHQKKEKKQKTEWERQMSLALRTVTRKKEKQIKEAAFAAWREASLDSRAFKFRKTSLLRYTLGKWLSNAARLAELHTEADALQASQDEVLVVKTFATWKNKTILLVRESEVVEDVEFRLLSHGFKSWQIQLEHVRLADEFASHISRKSAFVIWRSRKAHNDYLRLQAMSLSRARGEDTMERAFHTWKIREHSRLLERAKAIRLARGAMQRWRERYVTVTNGLGARATTFADQRYAFLAKRCLQTWAQKTHYHRKALRLASSLNSRLLVQRTFSDWKEALSDRRLEYRKAEVANTFFLQRNLLRTWYKRMRWVKADKAIAAKEADLVKGYFKSWREKTRRAQRFAILEEGISAAIDQRILSEALRSWTNRVIELRARAISVTQTRNNQVLTMTFSHWLNKSRQNIENLSLVDSFIEVQEEELLHNKFRKWLSNTRRKTRLRELLEIKMEDDKRNLLAGVFDRWFDVYKERQLIDQEMDIVRYRTYQSLGGALQKWKARTMTLPAIRFDAHRQRKRFFSIWRDRLPGKMDENQAIEYDRLRLLNVTLTIWQEGTRAKAARRAANRFRAFAARSPLPVHHTSSSHFTSGLSVPYDSSRLRPHSTLSTPRLQIKESSHAARTGAPPSSTSRTTHPVHGIANSAHASPLSSRAKGSIPSSTSMPMLYSASRLRKEVGSTPPPRKSALSTGVSPLPIYGNREQYQSQETEFIRQRQTIPSGRSRRGSNLDPESIALPPSSSATGASPSTSAQTSSSASSSPLAHQSPLPLPSPLLNPPISQTHDKPESNKRHHRGKSKSRDKDAFEEGILKEMRERLNAVGLGGGGSGSNGEGSSKKVEMEPNQKGNDL